jgi:phage baseplate assembly protein V
MEGMMRGFRGFITDVDTAKVKAKAKLTANDDMETDWLPVPQIFTAGARAFYLPRIGQQAYIFFLDDEGLQDGFILCARYSEKHTPPDGLAKEDFYLSLEDGTLIRLALGKVTVETPGDIAAKAGGNIEAKADGDITAKAQNITAKATMAIEADAGTTIEAKALTITAQATAAATIKAPAITLDSAAVTITGNLIVDGGIAVGAVGGGSVAASGPLTISAPSVTLDAPLTAGAITTTAASIGGKPFLTHTHTAPNGPTSPPV